MGVNRILVNEQSKCAWVLGLGVPGCSLETFLLGEGVEGVFEHLASSAVGNLG